MVLICSISSLHLCKLIVKSDASFSVQGEVLEDQARRKERTRKELAIIIFIRVVTNLLVSLLLVGAGFAIYFSAIYELNLVR